LWVQSSSIIILPPIVDNMKRKTIVAGNWKMNKALPEVVSFVEALDFPSSDDVEVIIGCSFPFLGYLSYRVSELDINCSIAAQNCHQSSSGAFTGEVSTEMIASTGAEYVIIGHSERRQYFNEDNELLNQKVKIALSNNLKVIYCCGEVLEERRSGQHIEKVNEQISKGLEGIDTGNYTNLIIAYEPVWAIGTGITASSDEAEEMHSAIRKMLPEDVRSSVSIVYGGSVKTSNFQDLLSQENVDGGLIGGASLDVESFIELIKIANRD
jgi:triosephosphate isomerase